MTFHNEGMPQIYRILRLTCSLHGMEIFGIYIARTGGSCQGMLPATVIARGLRVTGLIPFLYSQSSLTILLG